MTVAGDQKGTEFQCHNRLAWQQSGFSICAVSDVAPTDLAQMKQLFLAQ